MPPQPKNPLAAIRSPGGLRKSLVVQLAHSETSGSVYQFTLSPEDGYLESVMYGGFPEVPQSNENYITLGVHNRLRTGIPEIPMLEEGIANTTQVGGLHLLSNGSVDLKMHPLLENTRVHAGDRLRCSLIITGDIGDPGRQIFPVFLLRFVPLP